MPKLTDAQIEEWISVVNHEPAREALRELLQLRASDKVMRAALEWYAEQTEGCRKIGRIGDPFRHALDRDGGKLARAALRPNTDGETNG